MGRFAGKTALVTGAGSGLGDVLVQKLLAEGASVLAFDLKWAEALEHPQMVRFTGDVTQSEQVAAAFAKCVDAFASVDLVFNNAGTGQGGTRLHEISDDDFDVVMGVNARGVFLVLREALRAMLATEGGSIVNTASTASFLATPHTGAYCASKGAVLQMTRQASVEYGGDNIRVNCVCPGPTLTPLVKAAPEEIKNQMADALPMGRLGDPSEIVNVMLFLASDEASFVTGSAYVVNGGKIVAST